MESRIITLTPEQLGEFPTPLLQGFAEAYLRFRHSSPYTTRRKLFRYFEPLPAEKLTDAENMYGADREEAYKDLCERFKACRTVGAFDPLFGDLRHYWKSATVPGLVLLKKWL